MLGAATQAAPFSEGFANVGFDGKWGYIDKTGKYLIKPKFLYADKFSEGFAAIAVGPYGNEKYGYIDKTGKIVIPIKFDDAGAFSEGLAAIKIGEEWGYIDRTGKIVIEPQFNLAWNFSEGLARVINCRKPCTFEYIDRDRRVAAEFSFTTSGADDFHGGLATIITDESGFGYIDKTGKYVWKEK